MTIEIRQIITEAGRARLQDELKRLQREDEPEFRGRLREVRENGSLEDADLHIAVEDLLRVQARIDELEQLLGSSEVGAARPLGGIGIGSRVTARDDGDQEHVFVLVSPLEAGVAPGYISTESPVGAALMGRAPGDAVAVKVPAGERHFTVVSVE